MASLYNNNNNNVDLYITLNDEVTEERIKHLELDVQELSTIISTYDHSVFFNPLFKYDNFERFKIKKEETFIEFECVRYTKEVEHKSRPSNYNPYTGMITSQDNTYYNIQAQTLDLQQIVDVDYHIIFQFNKNGLCGLNVKRKSKNLLTVIIGDDKILINNKDWYEKDSFEETAFQQSLIEKRTGFDIFFISSVLKQLKLA